MTNKIGVILTTFNKLDLTKECLKSFYQTTEDVDCELIIVDNMSTDGTREFIKEQSIPIIEIDEWCGVSTALNKGIHYFLNKETNLISYDICWIHNDMTFYQGWLSALQKYLLEHPTCGRVASHNMRDPLDAERPGNELPFLIRGHCFKTIGMFDERYKGACGKEDWDMNWRLIDNGWSVMITPESKVFHKGAATRTGMCSREWEEHNNALYFSKFGTDQAKV